ncbi:DEDD exonuclease domain-containing protein [Amycolatopsis acidiphila]|uniref:DEDD exonuclease domain-containing protein n=1 Tax=Amycolatopsis acidiphila TaxID=715473 RepID=A0A558A1U2_9PSEU|nr:DEDD exonuclease domain-containing protein [Amycolatopsis acidiphila]TVT18215.1 DEDD exonuclease domain-containing protein [Amycolatopsis acidiphila]UIJ58446.1 DEDD exonuclease domain-containing protein [Amycolatopsis acidiphila]GHG93242.1 DNA polymerase III subunit epsilon [Amycolatopsis acidiphila]
MHGAHDQLTFDELGTPLRDTTFVVFDLETTGTKPGPDGITEIGAVKVRGGEVLGEFATLVNPGKPIPPQIVALTGITDAVVYDAPTIDRVLGSFLEFAAGAVLVAHNAPFDTGFMRAACAAYGYPWPKPAVVCTVKLARRVLTRQDTPSFRLSALAALFGSSTTPNHRALDDARATVDVLHALLERVGSVGVHSLEELVDYLPEVTDEQRRKRGMAAHLPELPGVYLFRGPGEEVLYVGTASNLRRRVRNYFTGSESRGRIREMVALAQRVDGIECSHALEAQIRELRLLAAYRPAYNRRSKNPRKSWWVVLTDEAFPRLSVVRLPKDGALGPFNSQAMAKLAADVLAGASGLRTCTQRISAVAPAGRPCAMAELGRCGAPCAGHQSVEAYFPSVRAVAQLIGGEDNVPLDSALRQLDELAAAQHYEQAARRRDELAILVRAVAKAHRLTALAAIPELVAAAPDGNRGWEFAVIRYGRLASAGVARRGVPPMPVVDALVAAAETVTPEPGPLYGAPPEEVGLLLRWLTRAGVRLVRTAIPWAEPAHGAGGWHDWLERASTATALEQAVG